jgi:CheY-like chemotaxis protein
MHERALAAEVIACLASDPGRVWAIIDLAAECGRSVAQVAAACGLLSRLGMLDQSVSGGVALGERRRWHDRPVVLVVENTAAVAHLVAALLDSEGYQVLIASTTALGGQVAKAIAPDLVIADSFSATARDGLVRLLDLRLAAAPAPVLVFTAYRDIDELFVRQAGYAGMLPKPFDIDDLLARVATAIGERRPPV